jgi:hypothetical protein
MWIWIRTLLFSLKFCGFVICDWDKKGICGIAIFGLIIANLRICDLRTGTPRKICELVIAD